MNKQRRASILKVKGDLVSLQVQVGTLLGQFEEIKEDLDDVSNAIDQERSDEEEYLENMPDGLKDGEKGELAQAAIDALQEAIDKIAEIAEMVDPDPFKTAFEEALDALDNAAQ